MAPVTWVLIAVNVVLFVLMLLHGAGLGHQSNLVQLEWGANFAPATADGEWWRLGSAMFLHFGVLHLGLNMLALWEVGVLLERVLGSPRFFLVYLIAGLGGNLLSLVMQGERAVSGGASGAIFGLYGALAISLWERRESIDRREHRWLFYGTALFIGISYGLGFVVKGIDNSAHLGGLAFGILAAIALHPVRTRTARGPLVRCLCVLAMLGACVFLLARIPLPRYRWHDELTARREIAQFLAEDKQRQAYLDRLLYATKKQGASFEELANRLDSDIAHAYAKDFQQLSAIRLDAASPSAPTIETLRKYAAVRRDAVHSFAEGLRNREEEEAVRQAAPD